MCFEKLFKDQLKKWEYNKYDLTIILLMQALMTL